MLEIEQLILRIPNVSPEEGRQMSQQIAQQIAAKLPAQNQSRYIENLDLQLRLSQNISNQQMVDQISGAIINRINRGNTISNNNSIQTTYSTRSERTKSHSLTPNEGSH